VRVNSLNKTDANRILSIDLMRAFAVFMMIQGHTTHSLLNISSIDINSNFYQLWLFFRAFTAPLFIFSAGFVFSYLLSQNEFDFKINPRILKGIYRGITLILIGYLLRYPTIKFFNIAYVSYSQWLTFFTVDALHLIGIGLLLIVFFSYLSLKIKVNPIITFSILTIIVFFGSPLFLQFEWENTKNIFIASYFTSKYGSIFPIFPYLEFVFFGAIWGFIISQENSFITKKLNLFIILIIGIALFYSSKFVDFVYFDSVLRFGALLILLSIFSFIGTLSSSLPKVVQSFSKNSLWIYIIHLVILYGSPTSIGLSQIIGNSLSAESTAIAVTLMLILMIFISLGIDKFRVRKFNYFRKNFRLE